MADTGTAILAALREEAKQLEKDVARGNYGQLEEFTKAQGMLFGVERALEICRKVVSEADDD